MEHVRSVLETVRAEKEGIATLVDEKHTIVKELEAQVRVDLPLLPTKLLLLDYDTHIRNLSWTPRSILCVQTLKEIWRHLHLFNLASQRRRYCIRIFGETEIHRHPLWITQLSFFSYQNAVSELRKQCEVVRDELDDVVASLAKANEEESVARQKLLILTEREAASMSDLESVQKRMEVSYSRNQMLRLLYQQYF